MPKVMIVDDDRTTVKLLKTLLELDGFTVSVAALGGEVMELAGKEQPDLFLLDYHLADMDGVEVLRQLRDSETFAKVPIVFASGLNVEDEVMEAGASAFLVKPFEPDELPGLFNRLLAQK